MPSGNAMLDGILWGGWHWSASGSTTAITYYFAHNNEFSGFDTNWTSTEQAGYRSALQSWANVANLTFTEVFSSGSATVPSGMWLELTWRDLRHNEVIWSSGEVNRLIDELGS